MFSLEPLVLLARSIVSDVAVMTSSNALPYSGSRSRALLVPKLTWFANGLPPSLAEAPLAGSRTRGAAI